MTDSGEAIDRFLVLRLKHRAARAAEENAYYTAQSAKEAIFREMQLDPYNRQHMAEVGKAIQDRTKELADAEEKTNG